MKILSYPIAAFLIALITGIYFGHQFNINSNKVCIITGIIFLLFVFVFYRKKIANSSFFGCITLTLFVLFGICNSLLHSIKNPYHYSHFYQPDSALSIQVIKELKPSTYYYKYVAEVKKVGQTATQGDVLLMVPVKDSLHQLHPDDQIITHVSISAISPSLNPHQFNYKKHLEQQGIYHQLKINKGNAVIISDKIKSIYGLAYALRSKIITFLQPYATGDELSIVKALFLGQRQDISPKTYQQYANAGAIHLLAISGLHVGILLFFFNYLLKPLERFKHGSIAKTILITVLLWGFAIVAGLSASVVRAVTMFSFIACAIQFKKAVNMYHTIISSMFFLLIFKPYFIFDVGFQLSYVAVFGIVWIHSVLKKLWKPKFKIVHYLWKLIVISTAAQLSVLPLTLYYFHQFPGLFFLSNMVLIPGMSLLLGLGIIVIILAFANALPVLLGEVFFLLIRLMNAFIAWIAQHEEYILTKISFDFYKMIGAYILIVFLVIFIKKQSQQNFLRMILGMLILTGIVLYENHQTSKVERLVVFHKAGHFLMAKQRGKTLISNDKHFEVNSMLTDYCIGERIGSIVYKPIEKSFQFKTYNILIIDSLQQDYRNSRPDVLFLTYSPKINLDRVIRELKPKKIIADGSNYPSLISLWSASCKKEKLPFYYTGKMGAYIIE